MRRAALGLLLACGIASAAPAPSDGEAQRAHAAGQCGSMGPGTGLSGGRGWVVSMLPGMHEFRMTGGGDVRITVAGYHSFSFDVGRPYMIVTEGAGTLEWKAPGRDWGPISPLFLYPPSGNPYTR